MTSSRLASHRALRTSFQSNEFRNSFRGPRWIPQTLVATITTEAAEKGGKHAHQALGGAALGQKVSRQSKQGQRGQHGIDDERVMRNRNGGNRLIQTPKQDQGSAAKSHKCRDAQE